MVFARRELNFTTQAKRSQQRSSSLDQAVEPKHAVETSSTPHFGAEGFGENVAPVHVRYVPKFVTETDVGSFWLRR